jgi:hypothetical protein
MRGEQHNPAGREEQARRMLQDWYHRPGGPPPGGAGVWQPLPPEIIRVRLTAEWPDDYDGEGLEVELDDDNHPQDTGREITLRDPLGLLAHPVAEDTYLWAIATYDGSAPGADKPPGPYFEPWPAGGAPLIPFELKTTIRGKYDASEDAGYGDAYLLLADHTIDEESDLIKVTDYHQARWSIGREDQPGDPPAKGARGLCCKTLECDGEAYDTYQIITIQEVGACRCDLLSAGESHEDPDDDVDMFHKDTVGCVNGIVSVHKDEQLPWPTLTVYEGINNPQELESKRGDECIIGPDYTDFSYKFLQTIGLAHTMWATVGETICGVPTSISATDGEDGKPPTELPTYAGDSLDIYAESGDKCLIGRRTYDDGSAGNWDIIHIKEHDVEVVEGFQEVDDCLQYRKVKVKKLCEPTEWIDLLCFIDECPEPPT